MPKLPHLLLVSWLFWITPLTASLKMAVAFASFKLITLGLSPGSVANAQQQGRLFGGWGIGWAIAIQNLEELKQGAYQSFLIHASFNIVLTGLTAYLCGRAWYQYKNRPLPSIPRATEEQPEPQTISPQLSPLNLIIYAVVLLILMLFKTGIAQFQIGQLYANGYLLQQNHDQALFWYQKSAEKGNSAASAQLK